MTPPNIILEPGPMFQTLLEMENGTKNMINIINDIAQTLTDLSKMTYADGFGKLIQQAEKDMNEFVSGAVAANNVFNSSCQNVVNQLVGIFTVFGARTDFSVVSPPQISIPINTPDRADIYPQGMLNHYEAYFGKVTKLSAEFSRMKELFMATKKFWQGPSAEKTRGTFQTSLLPHFSTLQDALMSIYFSGKAWIEETVKFDASLVQ